MQISPFRHQSYRIARASGARLVEGHALRVLGEIAAQRDPPDLMEAARRFEEAPALGAELGMRPLVAHCHLGLGKVCRRTGNRAKAEERVAAATAIHSLDNRRHRFPQHPSMRAALGPLGGGGGPQRAPGAPEGG